MSGCIKLKVVSKPQPETVAISIFGCRVITTSNKITKRLLGQLSKFAVVENNAFLLQIWINSLLKWICVGINLSSIDEE